MALPLLELPPIVEGSPCCRAALFVVEKVGRNWHDGWGTSKRHFKSKRWHSSSLGGMLAPKSEEQRAMSYEERRLYFASARFADRMSRQADVAQLVEQLIRNQ